MKINSQIYTDIDYAKEGKQLGQLDVPISTNTAGWANYYLPICVIKHGEGPTALIFGGNHGDEYEGPVTLMNLARWLQPEQVQGRVILLPMLNRPAVASGTRLSGVDGRNMNRTYYSQYSEVQVNESITTMIAHYVTQALIPLADLVIDIHSGGRSVHFLPSVNMHHVADESQMRAMLEAGLAWDAPYVFIYRDIAGEGLLPSYCERLGKAYGAVRGACEPVGQTIVNLQLREPRACMHCGPNNCIKGERARFAARYHRLFAVRHAAERTRGHEGHRSSGHGLDQRRHRQHFLSS